MAPVRRERAASMPKGELRHKRADRAYKVMFEEVTEEKKLKAYVCLAYRYCVIFGRSNRA